MNQPQRSVAVSVRAIDVGYFNVKYTKGRKRAGDANLIDVGIFPSLAPRRLSADFLKTSGPRPDVCSVAVDGIGYVVGPGCIYNLGGIEPRRVAEDYAMTAKYHALALGALHYMAADAGTSEHFTIDLLVVGLPLTTWRDYREPLAQRLKGEHEVDGLRVTVREVIVMVQPQGALINFGTSNKVRPDGLSLVVDPGGGTLDWYVAENGYGNWNLSGAYPKAMLQCNYAVADAIDESWRHQFKVVEQIDLALRTNGDSFTVGTKEYRLDAFRPQIEDVLRESIDAMLQKTGPLDSVRRVVVTGGGARLYHDYLTRNMPQLERALEIDTDPVFSNVKGFQVNGEVQVRKAVPVPA